MQSTPPILFDRPLLRKRRARMAGRFAAHDFMHREAAELLAHSLDFITYSFPTMVEIGAQGNLLANRLRTRNGTEHYLTCSPTADFPTNIVADEELLPFAENSVDAVVSILALQWVNDLPGTLAQIFRMLKPDGLFMAVLPGGETLRELRESFATTEARLQGGISPRIAPFIDVRDGGALLQRAGFALPVADSEQLTIAYSSFFSLMDDLRNTGHSNPLTDRNKSLTPRGLLMETAAHYATTHPHPEGGLAATVELVTLTGWKPAATQQQPARRGSGQISLETVFKPTA